MAGNCVMAIDPVHWKMEGIVLSQNMGKIVVNVQNELRFRVASNVANVIRNSIYVELGFTRYVIKEVESSIRSSAGVSYNKMMAKLASGKNKPNKQTVVMPSAASGTKARENWVN